MNLQTAQGESSGAVCPCWRSGSYLWNDRCPSHLVKDRSIFRWTNYNIWWISLKAPSRLTMSGRLLADFVRLATEAFMSIGTKSVLLGAHCFFLHPFFVALAWTRLYGFPRDWRLYLAFFVHDLGYAGKENIDGPEGEEHVHFGAAVMRRLCGPEWEEFTRCHSRYWAKKTGRPYSRLCVADKLAFVLTPLWLYIPMTRWTGELAEYMRRARFSLDDIRNLEPWEARCLQSGDERSFLVGLRSYTKRWVEHHRDLAEDHWTVARDWARGEETSAGVLR